MVKEKPILFSGPMVRAILEGRKNQTSRVIKNINNKTRYIVHDSDNLWYGAMFYIGDLNERLEIKCPYKVGDILWVREKWRTAYYHDNIKPSKLSPRSYIDYFTKLRTGPGFIKFGKWRPSIYMPKWASRIKLKVADIKGERLHEMRDHDAKFEGFYGVYDKDDLVISPKDEFIKYWDSLNEKRGYGWDKNPWVWVYTFELIK